MLECLRVRPRGRFSKMSLIYHSYLGASACHYQRRALRYHHPDISDSRCRFPLLVCVCLRERLRDAVKGSIKSSRAKCHQAHSDSSQDSCHHDARAANERAAGREESVAMAMATGERERREWGRWRSAGVLWKCFKPLRRSFPHRVCVCG